MCSVPSCCLVLGCVVFGPVLVSPLFWSHLPCPLASLDHRPRRFCPSSVSRRRLCLAHKPAARQAAWCALERLDRFVSVPCPVLLRWVLIRCVVSGCVRLRRVELCSCVVLGCAVVWCTVVWCAVLLCCVALWCAVVRCCVVRCCVVWCDVLFRVGSCPIPEWCCVLPIVFSFCEPLLPSRFPLLALKPRCRSRVRLSSRRRAPTRRWVCSRTALFCAVLCCAVS